MQYEVELKYPVPGHAAIREQLQQLGAQFHTPRIEIDRYFTHPCRCFGETDEALRIRRIGDDCFITYKGPRLDKKTKTRVELEYPLDAPDYIAGVVEDGAPVEKKLACWTLLLEKLGFGQLSEVRKERHAAELVWHDEPVEITLDDVDRVGTYVELEWVTEEHALLDEGRERVLSLAEQLGLADMERRSYLELLLCRKALSDE